MKSFQWWKNGLHRLLFFFQLFFGALTYLSDHIDDPDDGDQPGGILLGEADGGRVIHQKNIWYVVPKIQQKIWQSEEEKFNIGKMRHVEHIDQQIPEVPQSGVPFDFLFGDRSHGIAVDVGARRGAQAVPVDVQHGSAIGQREPVDSQVFQISRRQFLMWIRAGRGEFVAFQPRQIGFVRVRIPGSLQNKTIAE